MGSRDTLSWGDLSEMDRGILTLTGIISILYAVLSVVPIDFEDYLQGIIWPALLAFWILSATRLSAFLDRKDHSEYEERIEALLERIAGDSVGK